MSDFDLNVTRRGFMELLGAFGVAAALPADNILFPSEAVVAEAHAARKLVSGDLALLVGNDWVPVARPQSINMREELVDIASPDDAWRHFAIPRRPPQQTIEMSGDVIWDGVQAVRECFDGYHSAQWALRVGDGEFRFGAKIATLDMIFSDETQTRLELITDDRAEWLPDVEGIMV